MFELSTKGPGCFVYFSLKCIVVRTCLARSYKQASISLIITRFELFTIKVKTTTYHRIRHISVMHLMFLDFRISSMVYVLNRGIAWKLNQCKQEI